MKRFIFILCVLLLSACVQPGKTEMNNKAVENGTAEDKTITQETLSQETVLQEEEYIEWYVTTTLFNEFEDVKKIMPETLEKYLGNALINDALIEALLEIEAEYQILDRDEKKQFLDSCKSIELLSYEHYEGTDDDIWYLVDLYEKDDIVIWRKKEEYTDILYFQHFEFENRYFYAQGVDVGRTKKDQPYFIHWEGQNYMAIPYWDDSEENIIGVSIHIYGSGYSVVGIGVDENLQITVCYQNYNLGAVKAREGKSWYQIKPYREKEEDIIFYMWSALGDPVIEEYYHQDIEEVKKFSNGDIEIRDYNFDLNADGVSDKIVTICSPLHSVAMGDTLQILLNDGTGNYETIFDGNYPLYTQDESRERVGNINILNNKTNGFYDIEIISEDSETIIKYADGGYR